MDEDQLNPDEPQPSEENQPPATPIIPISSEVYVYVGEQSSHITWKCPTNCPYQADDSVWSMIVRLTLPILTAILIAGYWSSVVKKEDRSLDKFEAIIGVIALFLSYQPTLIAEATRTATKAAAKRFGG